MKVPNNIFFINGMDLKVIHVYHNRKLSKLTDIGRMMFGCRNGFIRPDCEHPEFICPYYGTTFNSGTKNFKEALKEYCDETKHYDLNKEYTFIETTYGRLFDYNMESPRTVKRHYGGIYDEDNINYTNSLPVYGENFIHKESRVFNP